MASVVVPPSASRREFLRNKADVKWLWGIHALVAGTGTGRKHNVEILNRSAMVLIAASWETYIEDVALEAWGILHAASLLPASVTLRTQAAVDVRVLGVKGKRGLNTPAGSNVMAVLRDVLGLGDVRTEWRWKKMSAAKAETKLDGYVGSRCDVAHRVRGPKPVWKYHGTDFLGHVDGLVECTDWAVFHHAKGLLGKDPW